MPGISSYQQSLLILQVVALLSLAVRLLWNGLRPSYPIFFYFLIIEAFQLLIPFAINYRTDLYGHLFLVTETLIICLYALVVLELYSIILQDLSGIAGLARMYTRIALGVAILVSILLLSFESSPSSRMAKFFTFGRAIVSSLLVFVFLITAFLVYYPIPLNRNVIVYSIGYAFYFLCNATALFARNLGLAGNVIVSNTLLGVSTLCLLFWLFFLDREGEKKAFVIGHRWDRGEEARLLKQIEAINSSLLRTARK